MTRLASVTYNLTSIGIGIGIKLLNGGELTGALTRLNYFNVTALILS